MRLDREEGVEQGIEKQFVETVKRMLENEFSEQLISKLAGRTIGELRNVKYFN